MNYKINSDIKPISATLKRLNIGKSFNSKDFRYELEEKKLDEFWDVCKEESGYLINNLTRNVEEKLAEIFILGVSYLYERHLNMGDEKSQNHFNKYLTTGICYHINMNSENSNYDKLIYELENIEILTPLSLNEIKATIVSAKRKFIIDNNLKKFINTPNKIYSKNTSIQKENLTSENKVNRKYQIFISSTFIDLIEERQAAVEAILKKGHIPAGMELFTAGNKSQWEVIKRWIDDSDIYLLILGGRYGSIDKSTGLSYTEMEYNYALEKGKPLFALSLTDKILDKKNISIIKDYDLKDPKYISFKEKVKSKMCAFPNNVDQIKSEINHSLDDLINENKDKMQGWIKGNI